MKLNQLGDVESAIGVHVLIYLLCDRKRLHWAMLTVCLLPAAMGNRDDAMPKLPMLTAAQLSFVKQTYISAVLVQAGAAKHG